MNHYYTLQNSKIVKAQKAGDAEKALQDAQFAEAEKAQELRLA